MGCSLIITGYLVMVMSHDLMEIGHMLVLISHGFVCLHMLMRFHYKYSEGPTLVGCIWFNAILFSVRDCCLELYIVLVGKYKQINTYYTSYTQSKVPQHHYLTKACMSP